MTLEVASTPAPMARTANDLGIYEREAADWWNPAAASFRSLHAVNEHRTSLLGEWLGERLDGLVVIDFGCGGGLLSRPLAERGATVLGFDVSHASLRAAREHSRGSFLRGDARRAPFADECADVVLMADVLEHVADYQAVLGEAARLLGPGGVAFVNTLNRTARARLFAVQLAEGVKLVPRGTHDPELFIAPDDLARAAWSRGLALERLQGESVNLWRTLRRWAISLRRSDDLSIGYSALLRKERRT